MLFAATTFFAVIVLARKRLIIYRKILMLISKPYTLRNYITSDTCFIEDRMFSYNSSLLYMNNDNTLIQLLVPSGGVPIGIRIHNVIYVSAALIY